MGKIQVPLEPLERTRQGEPVTLDDDRRWKKHYKSFKRLAYEGSFASPLFRKNFDNIKWKVRRADEVARGDVSDM